MGGYDNLLSLHSCLLKNFITAPIDVGCSNPGRVKNDGMCLVDPKQDVEAEIATFAGPIVTQSLLFSKRDQVQNHSYENEFSFTCQ